MASFPVSVYLTYALIGWAIRAGMVPVVLRRQFAPGASVAWLGIVFLHPYVGLVLYLLVGESRLGPRRTQRHRQIVARFRDPARNAERAPHQTTPEYPPAYHPMVAQAEKISGLPVLSGNQVEFLTDAAQFRLRLCAEIGAARKSVNLLYYIFTNDATARAVADALVHASQRGVKCRVLADALASRAFFHHAGLSTELIAAGVEVVGALPVAPFRRRLARMDLRNHRKLAIFDDQFAYVGSHNIVNPDYGGRRGNPWIDVTGRYTGPIVGELASIFAEDWAFETGKEIEIPYPRPLDAAGDQQSSSLFAAQVVPTGPTIPDATYRRLLLAAIQSARESLILTTPYFVPDETTLLSLMMAADRGVDVKLILPMIADHFFAAAAGRAHYHSLLHAGVGIYLYQPALLHAKTVTVDDAFGMFGSANLDVRSFSLNFELMVLLYGQPIARRLRAIQDEYLSLSKPLKSAEWDRRPTTIEYTDRAVALLSPLL
jgi:cardiolipin synthase A/B